MVMQAVKQDDEVEGGGRRRTKAQAIRYGLELHEIPTILAERELLLFPVDGEATPGAVQYPEIRLEDVETYMLEIGLKYRGRWQRKIMRHLIANRFAILKGPRQNSGKTWAIAVLLAYCICKLGMPWVIAMPTMRQGSRILIDRVTGFCARYETKYQDFKRIIKNVNYTTWNNGGMVASVSLHVGSKAGVQGYTAVGLVIDEGHETDRTIYDAVLPVLDVAAADEQSRVIVSGIGGTPHWSLICILAEPPEESDEDGERDTYQTLTLHPYHDIGADSPKLLKFFKRTERSVSATSWRRNYLCEDFTEGGNVMFPSLEKDIAGIGLGRMEFGIDVGRTHDWTIVVAMRVNGSQAKMVDRLRLRGREFELQAAQIADWINKWEYLPQNIRIERNGLGWGLYDELKKLRGFSVIRPVTTSDKPPHYKKTRLCHDLMHRANKGNLAIDLPDVRRELSMLTYEQNEKGEYEWPDDCDILSALWVWESGMRRAFAA